MLVLLSFVHVPVLVLVPILARDDNNRSCFERMHSMMQLVPTGLLRSARELFRVYRDIYSFQ